MSVLVYIYIHTFREKNSRVQGLILEKAKRAFRNVKEKDGRVPGLMVREQYAQRFVTQNGIRKTMEIRTIRVNFLKEGDEVALISVNRSKPRMCLGILKYKGIISMDANDLSKHFHYHRLTDLELDQGGFSSKEKLWGWYMEAVEVFDPPLILNSGSKPGGPIVWLYFSLSDLACNLPDSCSKEQTSEIGSTDSLVSICDELPTNARSQLVRDTSTESWSFSKRSRLSTEDQEWPDVESMSDCQLQIHDFASPNGEVYAIVLHDREWGKIQKGASFIVRPYNSHHAELFAFLRSPNFYMCYGVLHIRCCFLLDRTDPEIEKTLLEYYSKFELEALKRHKQPYFWQLDSVTTFDVPSPVPWVDTAYRNRTIKLKVSALQQGFARAKVKIPKPDLRETCDFFMGICDPVYQCKIFDTILSLDRSTIRIGTTCSGSDIVITVFKQTLAALNKQKAAPAL